MISMMKMEERVYTRDIVRFLISQPDQVATTKDIADALHVSEDSAKSGLVRLQRVSRVDEISKNMWHLE